MKLTSIFVVIALCAALSQAADVYSGRYRGLRNRMNPVTGGRRFFLLSGGDDDNNGGLRRPFLRRRHKGRHNAATDETVNSNIGPSAALRAGKEGAYDFSDQYNAIIPDKNAGKPTKSPVPETENDNKINIESKLPQETERDASVEKVHAKGTAIVHCTFDNVEQVGTYKQAKIWWTKLSEREVDKPVILAAGSQVRVPDDRLRVVTFPDNTFSILIIKNILPEDAGQYKCSLPMVSGTKTTFTTLEVLEEKNDQIATSASETILNSGDNLNLFCRPDDSSLSVWWTAKDAAGNSIMVGNGFDKLAGQTLTISSIQRTQAGVYTCHIESYLGSPVRKHFTVQVKEKPWEIEAYIGGFQMNTLLAKFYKDPVYGDDVNLRCDTGGVPTPSVQWYKDGRLLSNGGKYTITDYEPSYKLNSVIAKLTITNFQSSDDGTYTCKAENDAGSQQQDFLIKGKHNSLVSNDDEDGYAALRGRSGQITVKACKGSSCKPQTFTNSDDSDEQGSGSEDTPIVGSVLKTRRYG